MIYFTGDTHGDTLKIIRFAERMHLRKEDTIIILGDAGYNYYGNERDRIAKQRLSRLKPTILCIHGNHEIRPANIPTYQIKAWNGGIVWYEDEYPNLLFAKDGEIYTMNGLNYMAIGGAYSVDKFYRVACGYGSSASSSCANSAPSPTMPSSRVFCETARRTLRTSICPSSETPPPSMWRASSANFGSMSTIPI